MLRANLKGVGETAFLCILAGSTYRALKIFCNEQTKQGSPMCSCDDVDLFKISSLNFLKFQIDCTFTHTQNVHNIKDQGGRK